MIVCTHKSRERVLRNKRLLGGPCPSLAHPGLFYTGKIFSPYKIGLDAPGYPCPSSPAAHACRSLLALYCSSGTACTVPMFARPFYRLLITSFPYHSSALLSNGCYKGLLPHRPFPPVEERRCCTGGGLCGCLRFQTAATVARRVPRLRDDATHSQKLEEIRLLGR